MNQKTLKVIISIALAIVLIKFGFTLISGIFGMLMGFIGGILGLIGGFIGLVFGLIGGVIGLVFGTLGAAIGLVVMVAPVALIAWVIYFLVFKKPSGNQQ